ncbi:hypothetical protein GLYMA_13G085200v4 [Glycine max]|nr:hypothetical protein GLYMA_13G085200v4 [Glycine max]KAH1100436.1 hypothetical protein GYH30_035552 [Glycine max]
MFKSGRISFCNFFLKASIFLSTCCTTTLSSVEAACYYSIKLAN